MADITLLSDELKDILKAKGAHLRQLGTDAETKSEQPPLRLPDGELVGDVKLNSARNYTRDDFNNHVFPNDGVLVRLGVWAELGFLPTLHLVLKGRWERYFKEYVPGDSLFEAFRRSRAKAQNLAPRFVARYLRRADTQQPAVWAGEIHALFDRYFGIAAAGYGLEPFTQLCEQLVLGYLHLFGRDSPELACFIENHGQQRSQEAAAPADERAEFERCNQAWHAGNTALGEQLWEQEQLIARRARDELEFRATFGDLLVPRAEARQARLSLERQIEYKRTDPTLAREALLELDRQAQAEEDAELVRLRADIDRAKFRRALNGITVAGEQAAGMQATLKKTLRKIFMLTAPDRTAGEGFTEEQRERLRGFFDEAQQLFELQAPFQPDPAEVECLLESAQALWHSAGLDINAVFQIPAELSLTDKIAWLKRRTAWLDEQLLQLKLDYTVRYNNPEWGRQRAALATPEAIARTRGELEAQMAQDGAAIAALQRELDTLFAKAA